MSSFKKFNALHHGSELFVLPNAWDARSAIMLEQNGFSAIGTSSAAVANSLGYEDGENMPLTDYLFVISRIISSINIPLTVDIETGYASTDEEIANNILRLAELGVTGINIEDSVIKEGKRSLNNAEKFAETVSYVKQKLHASGYDLFINLRCDTYILNVDSKEQETISRLKIYNDCGADGIFIPCISRESDIADVIKNTRLPLNVMAIPGLPDLGLLTDLGVKRLSMGPFMFHKVYAAISALSKAIHAQGNVSAIVS